MDSKLFLTWLGISLPLMLSPFLLGGVYSHLETGFIIIFAVAAVSAVYSGCLLFLKRSVAVSLLLLPFGALLLYSILQLIPVPETVLKFISPKGFYFHMIESGGARPVTMSVPDTFYSSVRIVSIMLFAFFVSEAVYCGSRKIRQMLLDTILYISTVFIMVSAVVEILQIKKWIYGSLRNPGFLIEPVIVNPNHAAAYFGVSGILALILALKDDFKRKQILYGAIFFIHTIAVASTVSKGGILAYIISIIFLLFIQRKGRKRKEPRNAGKMFLTFSVMLALTVVFYSGYTMLAREFVDRGKNVYFEKAGNIKSVGGYFSDFYLTGSGTGSFSKVYPYYQSNPERHFDQLENEPVQLVLETGVPFAIFLLLLFIAALRGKREKQSSAFAAVIFFILLHNLVDFNLHNFSTLFPVAAVLVIIAKPVFLSDWKKKFFLIPVFVISVLTMIVVSTEKGRTWCGYNLNDDYASLVNLYPADYSVPMNEAVRNINSKDSVRTALSGQFVSSAVMKAPKYYFVYYLAGKYMTAIGSSQGIEFYKKSVSLSDPLSIELLKWIYRDLRYMKKESEMPEIIKKAPEESNGTVEKFLRETAVTDSYISKYVLDNRDKFFIPAINIYMKNGNYEEAWILAGSIEKKNIVLSSEQSGQIHMFKGLFKEKKGEYQEAFNEYFKGSSLTGSFSDLLVMAYSSLRLGNKEIAIADGKLKSSNLQTTVAMARYYKWLSKKEFHENNFAKGIRFLERSAEMTKDPETILEIARIYSRQKMYMKSLENLSRLKKHHPDFRKDAIDTLFKQDSSRLSERETEIFREFMLKQGH